MLARATAVLAVVVAPWLYGAADPWAYLLVGVLLVAAGVLWLLPMVHAPRRHFVAPGTLWFGVLVCAFLVFQQLPLPRGVVEKVSPETVRLKDGAREALISMGLNDNAAGGEMDGDAYALSMSPGATRRSLYRMISVLVVFMIFASGRREWGHLRRTTTILVAAGALMAVFGILQEFSGTKAIYGFHRPRLGGTFFGPFTNRNHFAAHMNMLIGLGWALVLSSSEWSELRKADSPKDVLRWAMSPHGSRLVLLVFLLMVMGASVMLSLSRGGMVSLAFATALITYVARRKGEGTARTGAVLGTFALCAVGLVIWLGWESVAERLGSLGAVIRDPLHDHRSQATFTTLRMTSHFLFAGCGYGCFRYIFPLYQGSELAIGRWYHAHNDVAEVLAEGGLIGAVLYAGILISYLHCLRVRYAAASRDRRLFMLGVLVGLVAIGVHSFLDYGLHRPANAILLAALAGLGVAAGELSPHIHGEYEQEARAHWPRGVVVSLCVAGLIVIGIGETGELRSAMAFGRFLQWERLAATVHDPEMLSEIVSAAAGEADVENACAACDPEALRHVAVGMLLWMKDKRISPRVRVEMMSRMESAAVRSVTAAPTDYEGWLWLGRVQMVLGNEENARQCMRQADLFAPAPRFEPETEGDT